MDDSRPTKLNWIVGWRGVLSALRGGFCKVSDEEYFYLYYLFISSFGGGYCLCSSCFSRCRRVWRLKLQSALQINNPYITIAGQTAPGDGICLKDYPFIVVASHVIVRYMRSRLGDNIVENEWDSVNLLRGWNIILDHCSASWSVDETLSAGIVEGSINTMGNLTVQWCIISESLYNSVHPKGKTRLWFFNSRR